MDVRNRVVKVEELDPSYGEWSPYSPWELWNLQPLGGYAFVSSRTRMVTNHVRTTTDNTRCRPECPPGYNLIGYASCELAMPDEHHYYPQFDLAHHVVTSYGAVISTQDYQWTETEFRYRVTDILKSIFTPGPVPGLSGRRGSKVFNPGVPVPTHSALALGGKPGTRAKKGEAPLMAAVLPALCEGDSLALSRGAAKYTVTVNGTRQPPSRPLVATKLGVGFHTIEVKGNHPESGKSVWLQLPLSVISPIELNFPPITKMTLKGIKNGGIVKVQLHNRSRSQYAIRVDPESVPMGWQAFQLEKALFVLKPGKSAQVAIQLERMVAADVTRDPLPFSVRVSFPGTKISTARAMFYVIAHEVFGKGGRPKRPKAKLFGDSDR